MAALGSNMFEREPGMTDPIVALSKSLLTANDCVLCHKLGTKICTGCGSIKYCSAFCQKLDWPLHKSICKQFGKGGETINAQKPKDGKHVLCIYFPKEKGGRPKLVWVKVNRTEGNFEAWDTDPYLGKPDGPVTTYEGIYLNPYSDKVMPRDHIPFILSKGDDDEEGNWTLDNLRNAQGREIPGAMLLIARGGHDPATSPLIDINAADLRWLIDHCLVPAMPDLASTLFIRDPTGIDAILVNCKGDQIYLNRPKYNRINLYKEHPIFNPEYRAISSLRQPEIATALGIPLWSSEVQYKRAWEGRPGYDYPLDTNHAASWLHLVIDPKSEYFLTCEPALRLGKVGTYLVVRQDKKALPIEHVEMLAEFGFWAKEEIDEKEGDRVELVKEYFSREKFREFVEEWCEKEKKEVAVYWPYTDEA